jgi:hypothetical protein
MFFSNSGPARPRLEMEILFLAIIYDLNLLAMCLAFLGVLFCCDYNSSSSPSFQFEQDGETLHR